jgi:5'-nucleotidase
MNPINPINPSTPQAQFIITASGRRMYPMAPTVDMVRLTDIAAALSKMPRWTGHTKGDIAYSVAQHAVMVSQMVPPEYKLEALHHDSSEAYLVDVARPLKLTKGFREVYLAAEADLTRVIYEAFDIGHIGGMSDVVREADNRMLATEARDIMPVPVGGWDAELSKYVPYRGITCIPWGSVYARDKFIAAHYQYLNERQQARQNVTGDSDWRK